MHRSFAALLIFLASSSFSNLTMVTEISGPTKYSDPPEPSWMKYKTNPSTWDRPLTISTETMPPPHNDALIAGFLDNLRSKFSLEHLPNHPKVRQEINWVRRNPKYLERLAPRMERYLPIFCEQVYARKMPAELCLLPIIESALDPYAFSPSGAAGFWQFMPLTAKRYGLKIDWWVDERRDPFQSTDAALRYLSDLHVRFGDWLLAIAAYNWGEGNIARARRKVGENSSFFDLRVPRETSAYVPRLLAFAAIFSNPTNYGITIPGEIGENRSIERRFTEIFTFSQIDMARIAEVTTLSIEELYHLNPSLNQWATHPKGPHRIIFPYNLSDTAQKQLAKVPANDRVRWQRHLIKLNETLGHIANRYRTSVAAIKKVNKLKGNTIRTGDYILIPRSSLATADYPTPTRRREISRKIYVVQKGDSLWDLSRRTGISIDRLMRTNHIGPKDYLHIGQRLVLPESSSREVVRSINYRVRTGDSLARIANKFNVSINNIVLWNDLDRKAYIHPGQRITLHINVTAPHR